MACHLRQGLNFNTKSVSKIAKPWMLFDIFRAGIILMGWCLFFYRGLCGMWMLNAI